MKSNQTGSSQGTQLLIVIAAVLILILAIVAIRVHLREKVKSIEAWQSEVNRSFADIFNELRNYCHSQTNYPALTAEELHQRGVFDDQTMEFLKSPKVHFYPFAATDPDTNVILSVVGVWPDISLGNKSWQGSTAPVELTKRDIMSTDAPPRWLDTNTFR